MVKSVTEKRIRNKEAYRKWSDADRQLEELSEKAMKRYIETMGVMWIYEYIDHNKEKQILTQLSAAEKEKYEQLQDEYDIYFRKAFQKT